MNKKSNFDRESLIIISVLFILAIVMVTVFIKTGVEKGYTKGFDEGTEVGIRSAESNCLKLICENNDCATIQIITQVQNYCKSLVYGTNFYMGLE